MCIPHLSFFRSDPPFKLSVFFQVLLVVCQAPPPPCANACALAVSVPVPGLVPIPVPVRVEGQEVVLWVSVEGVHGFALCLLDVVILVALLVVGQCFIGVLVSFPFLAHRSFRAASCDCFF